MARQPKKGLEYFPMDVSVFQDIKIRKLIKYQGSNAFSIYSYLLCLIYKDGYYMKYDPDLAFIVSEFTGFDEEYISRVFNCCLDVDLFHKELFLSHKIITSKGIQERFSYVMKSLNRVSVINVFNLISWEETRVSSQEIPISSEEIGISSEEMAISSQVSTQRKEKKRKEKKIKGKEIKKEKINIPKSNPEILKSNKEKLPFSYPEIISLYHTKCPKMPRVELLHDARKTAIKNRFTDFNMLGFQTMFSNAGESSFLNGDNDRNWIANFDWLLKPVNFTKVLEGNFKNINRNGNSKANAKSFAKNGYQEAL